MDKLYKSCQDAESFPGNLIDPSIHPYGINAYVKRLAEQRSLFSGKGDAALHFWESEFKGYSMFAKSRWGQRVAPTDVASFQSIQVFGISVLKMRRH